MRIVTSQQMRQIEQNSLAYDLTFARLMENAGSAAAAFVRRTFALKDLNCMVFCGRGNNGGDGLVMARKLYESEANVVVVLVDGPPAGDEAAGMYSTVKMMELPIFEAGKDKENEKIESCLRQADLVIDAVYGTGFRGELPRNAAYCCKIINDSIAAVIALDIPTGIEADTGRASPGAVKADFTVVFDSCKPAHALPATEELCGALELVDIGIPEEARAGIESRFGPMDEEKAFAFLPKRAPNSHKGMFGTLLAVCGSPRYRGAALLASMSALRCGVGICCLAAPEEVCAAVTPVLPEAVFLPLKRSPAGVVDVADALPKLREQHADAVLFGCGLGDTLETRELLEFFVESCEAPLIIDADGLNALAKNIHVLQRRRGPTILTPHPGEMARLTGKTVQEIESNRFAAAMEFAERHKVTVVLKGHETLTAMPDGGLYRNTTGNAGLAKSGSGDLLAGMIGAFAAQGIPPGAAAATAVFLHGLAADRTAGRLSQYAMLPHEILQDLAALFAEQGR